MQIYCVVRLFLRILPSMNSHPGTCGALPSTSSGMGQHFSSPKRRRHKRKNQTDVIIPGQNVKRQRLLQRLDDLLNCKLPVPPSSVTNDALSDEIIEDASGDTDPIQHEDNSVDEDIHHNSTPSVATCRLYDNWITVIPTVIESYLQYLAETIGKPLTSPDAALFGCHGGCEPKPTSLLCLYFDRTFLADIIVWTLISF